MTRKTLIVALLAASLGTGAFAQSQDATAEANSAFIQQIQTGKIDASQWATAVTGLDAGAKVQILPLTSLLGDDAETPTLLDKSLHDDQADVTAAQKAVANNQELATALAGKNLSASDVIAIDVQGPDDVTLVVDDRS